MIGGKNWDTVYVGSNDDNVYALNAANGDLVWSYTTQGNVRAAAAVALNGSVVYVGGDDANLYALDAAVGKVRS